jgi:hypothetical protein
VWRSCDGETGVEEIAAGLRLDRDTVTTALAELESNALLDGPILSNGTTRREFSIKTAKVGAAAAAAPMIYSILAPTPAAAATPSFAQCNFYSAKSCDGCTNICGCCCCCQGCSTATGVSACKICQPSSGCSTAIQGANCQNVPGVSPPGCNPGPHCSATALNGPVCADTSESNYPPPPTCCFPACTNGAPTLCFGGPLTGCNCGSGSGSQVCNCTGEDNPCGAAV